MRGLSYKKVDSEDGGLLFKNGEAKRSFSSFPEDERCKWKRSKVGFFPLIFIFYIFGTIVFPLFYYREKRWIEKYGHNGPYI